MQTSLLTFAVAFVYISLRAFQQRNVSHANYSLIIPTSYLMALTDTYLIGAMVKSGLTLSFILTYGTAGAKGSVMAVILHKRWTKK